MLEHANLRNLMPFSHRSSGSHSLVWFSFLYLALPFVLFAFGWYQFLVGLAALLALAITLRHIYLDPGPENGSSGFKDPRQPLAIAVIGLWVLLSGIGGYFFQNHDFHWRNAIFHDLIQYPWPVIYPGASPTELVYYIGFWLPAALVGKGFGWAAANAFLLAWAWLGAFLTLKLISNTLRISLLKLAIFLIFFSGMDAAGVVIMRLLIPGAYPTLWPPTQHLEWWAGQFQYSSFTTQLFWVFNQALPAWLCTALFLHGINKKHLGLAVALCFFYAPLPAMGLATFALIAFLSPGFYTGRAIHLDFARKPGAQYWLSCKASLKNSFQWDNLLTGVLVLFLAFFYFRVNHTGSLLGIKDISPGMIFLAVLFIVLEGGVLWLALFRDQSKNLFWVLSGLWLFFAPFFELGYSQDLMMRATIPALLFLAVWIVEKLHAGRQTRSQRFTAAFFAVFLAAGALTPLYEMTRSVDRTAGFVLCPRGEIAMICQSGEWRSPEVKKDINLPYHAEQDHPGSLVADDLGSLAKMPPADLQNFVAQPDDSALGQLLFRVPFQ